MPTRGFGNLPGPGSGSSGGSGAPVQGIPVDHTWLIVFGELMHLLIVLLVLGTFLLAVRMWLHGRRAPVATPSAITELEVLYAKGDVTRDEYLARRADLAGG